jgi:hypothetical protein
VVSRPAPSLQAMRPTQAFEAMRSAQTGSGENTTLCLRELTQAGRHMATAIRRREGVSPRSLRVLPALAEPTRFEYNQSLGL